jgi:myo-inositol-1(or 4)-monophosphatase
MNPNKKSLPTIKILTAIAQQAGKVLIENFRMNNFIYARKPGKANIVTNIDREVQRLIIKELTQRFPNTPTIGEEDGDMMRKCDETFFLVDPLDGTLNFVHGLPFFAISIALVKGDKPIAGVVHAPVLKETFAAVLNCGAFMNGQRIQCYKSLPCDEALGTTGWPYHLDLIPWAQRALLAMQRDIQEVRILGAAALELCYVAAGIIDIYWEVGLQPWDLAAGSLIVSEAGGKIGDINGNAFNLLSGQILAARNEQLYQCAVHTLKICKNEQFQ